MILVLSVILTLSALVVVGSAVRAYQARKRLHDPNYDDNRATALRYFSWIRSVLTMSAITICLLVWLVAEVAFDGLTESELDGLIVTCVVLSVLGIVGTMVAEYTALRRTSS